MLVFVFNGDGGMGKKVTESGFAYDSTANVGRKRKAGGVFRDIFEGKAKQAEVG